MEYIKKPHLRRAWAQIHLDRLERNLSKCRSLLPDGVDLMCVVKANAYGHGVGNIIPCLLGCGVEKFAVSNLIEAIELRELGVKGDILILGYTPPENAGVISDLGLIQAITDEDYAKKLSECLGGKTARCHLALDTGMTRIGLRGDAAELSEGVKRMLSVPGLKTEALFTHLSVADSADPGDIDYTKKQIELICAVKSALAAEGRDIPVHFLNSAGAAYHPDSRSCLARFGIMLYGLKPNSALKLPVQLEPVMELKAMISQIKTVEPGVDISYGRKFTTERQTKVAVVTIGYADGYPRQLSQKADVLIRGKRAPVLGRVCMDMLMADVTDIPGAEVGDTVTLFGTDGGETITADELAEKIGTIGYEIVCGISRRVELIEDRR